jgi:prepilin-type N-terminal cleavage/methylation domain-containing protein
VISRRAPAVLTGLQSVKYKCLNNGFTVIELVAVLVLIGVLAVTSFSRWFGGSSFDSTATAADISTVARLAQRIAVFKPGNIISLEVKRVAGIWQLAVMEDDGGSVSNLFQIDNNSGNTISITGLTGPITLSAANNLVVNYDDLGNISALLVGGVAIGATVGVAISISTDSPRLICISPVGFVHAGACV